MMAIHRSILNRGRTLRHALLMTAAFATCATQAFPQNAANFTYDPLGRVTAASFPDGSTVSYQYDAAGNRTQVIRSRYNYVPVANADAVTTAYITPITSDPRINDVDANGDPLMITAVGAPSHGTTSFTSNSITYTPANLYTGSDSFSYTISDGQGGTATATISVTVSAPTAPNVSNTALSVAYNTAGNVNLPVSGVYTATSVVTAPAHGTTSISGSTATFTPTSGYYGTDTFTFRATGPGGNSAPATVSVTVGMPPAPTASATSLSVAYNTAGTVTLPAAGVFTGLSVVSAPTYGTASISGTTATFSPTSGYYGSDSFTFRATGPGGNSAPATVSLTVANPLAPAVSPGSISAVYNTSANANLTITGVYNSLAISTAPLHGSVSISGTTATFTPTAGYYGSDSFAYTATGPGGTSAPATVTISVANPPAPTVSNKSLSVPYNGPASVNLAPSGVYSSVAVGANPAHGSVSISGANATFTPATNYYGADSFTFTATGPGGTSTPATVSVTVANPPAPTVSNKSLSVPYNGPASVNLAPSGVYLSVAIGANPAHGTVSVTGTNATFTPTTNYYGSDSFTFTATGPGGTSAPATVTATVANPPAPSVSNKTLNVPYNGLATVNLAPSGVYTSVVVGTNPAHGIVSINGANATFTPTVNYYGSDSFTFTATGPGGASAPATVSVSVATPAAPTVANTSLTSAFNTTSAVTLLPSGAYSSLAIAANPTHGTVSLSGTTATYTPGMWYSGSDSFTYTATGPGGTSTAATVNVTVQAPAIPTIYITSAANLRTLANNAGYTGAANASYQFVVKSGMTIMGAADGGKAIETGTWPAGTNLSLIVQGIIYGGGGKGGAGSGTAAGANGTTGGDAIYAQAPITITVGSTGIIKAGGGGGGGGSYNIVSGGKKGGGGGGGGFPNGAGGAGGVGNKGTGGVGFGGTVSGGGAGGASPPAGTGGNGGNSGSAGGAGNGEDYTSAGGATGYAVRKNGNTVTVTNNGTVTGTQG